MTPVQRIKVVEGGKIQMMQKITHIGFDADDTLWHCEDLFFEAHQTLQKLLPDRRIEDVIDAVYDVERLNLELYGYGVKTFILSLVETYLTLKKDADGTQIEELLNIGKSILDSPTRIFEGVENTLEQLSQNYKLLLITKGELVDQERKISNSKLANYFDFIDIISEKTPRAYAKLLSDKGIFPNNFVMIGNSVKSDILPVLKIGGHAIHIPYKYTWKHEEYPIERSVQSYPVLYSIAEVAEFLEERGKT